MYIYRVVLYSTVRAFLSSKQSAQSTFGRHIGLVHPTPTEKSTKKIYEKNLRKKIYEKKFANLTKISYNIYTKEKKKGEQK